MTTAQNRTFRDGYHIGGNDNPAYSYSSDEYRILWEPSDAQDQTVWAAFTALRASSESPGTDIELKLRGVHP
jgi:hypothetical protein